MRGTRRSPRIKELQSVIRIRGLMIPLLRNLLSKGKGHRGKFYVVVEFPHRVRVKGIVHPLRETEECPSGTVPSGPKVGEPQREIVEK